MLTTETDSLSMEINNVKYYLQKADGEGQSITVTQIKPEIDKVSSTINNVTNNKIKIYEDLYNAGLCAKHALKLTRSYATKLAIKQLISDINNNNIELSSRDLSHVEKLSFNQNKSDRNMTALNTAYDNNVFLKHLSNELKSFKNNLNSNDNHFNNEQLNEFIASIKTQIENNNDL